MYYFTALIMIIVFAGIFYIAFRSYSGKPAGFSLESTRPLRGLLALLIVAHHLGLQSIYIPILSYFCLRLGAPIVATFFFMSGYGLGVSFLKKGNDYLRGFLSKRFSKLLPTFILLTIICICLSHCLGYHSVGMQMSDLVEKGITPLPHSWFMYVIIYAYLAFLISAKVSKSPLITGLLLLVFSLLYIYFFGVVLAFPSYWWMTIMSINVGYFVGIYDKQIMKIIREKGPYMLAFSITALFVSACAYSVFHKTVIAVIIGYAIFAFTVYILISLFGMKNYGWLVFVSTFSMELYLVHGISLSLCVYLGVTEYYLWIATYAASLPLAYVLSRCVTPLASKLGFTAA